MLTQANGILSGLAPKAETINEIGVNCSTERKIGELTQTLTGLLLEGKECKSIVFAKCGRMRGVRLP